MTRLPEAPNAPPGSSVHAEPLILRRSDSAPGGVLSPRCRQQKRPVTVARAPGAASC